MDHEPDGRPSIKGQDENRLAELGYKQELRRNWSLLHNFGVSFSIIVSPYSDDICMPCTLPLLLDFGKDKGANEERGTGSFLDTLLTILRMAVFWL